jgi:uncharacterized protein DUF3135
MKKDKPTPDFDFDQWVSIAKTNPEQFELMRQQLINDAINQAPDDLKQRMEGLQWQIDQICNQANSPIDACLSISQKMLDNIYGEKGLVNAITEPEKVTQSINNNNHNKVVSIKKYKSTD